VTTGLRPGLVILALSLLSSSAVAAPPASIQDQLASRGIRDQRVLDAFARVPRDTYVTASAGERTDDDRPLPGGYSQPITQPVLLARMIEVLGLKPEDRVLEIGTGTGYAAALLAELAREVFSVGVVPEMATTARLRLTRNGYQNVHVKLGEGAQGWREYGPYDAVLVTSVGSRVPSEVLPQIVEGGALVMVVGPPRGRQVLIRGVKRGFKLYAHEVVEIRTVAPRGDQRDAGDQRRPAAAPPRVTGDRDPRTDR